MAFIRYKTINGHKYAYLVRSVRDGDKVRQEYIQYLGTGRTPEADTRVLAAYEAGTLRRPRVSAFDAARAVESLGGGTFRHYIHLPVLLAYLEDLEAGIASFPTGAALRIARALVRAMDRRR